MVQNIELDLQKLGLDEREARVYLAALELGPSPVQKIAQRADVPRATTYLVLDGLKAKGLVATYEEGKKTFFVIGSPDQLVTLVAEREAQLKEQHALLKNLVPELLSRGQYERNDKPTVRYYEGPSGIRSFVRDIMRAPGDELVNLFCHDDAEDIIQRSNISWDYITDKRKKTKTKRRGIYTWRQTPPAEGYHDPKYTIYVPFSEFPVAADIEVKGNHVGITPYGQTLRGVIIEDSAIAATLRLVFNVLWQHYRKKVS